MAAAESRAKMKEESTTKPDQGHPESEHILRRCNDILEKLLADETTASLSLEQFRARFYKQLEDETDSGFEFRSEVTKGSMSKKLMETATQLESFRGQVLELSAEVEGDTQKIEENRRTFYSEKTREVLESWRDTMLKTFEQDYRELETLITERIMAFEKQMEIELHKKIEVLLSTQKTFMESECTKAVKMWDTKTIKIQGQLITDGMEKEVSRYQRLLKNKGHMEEKPNIQASKKDTKSEGEANQPATGEGGAENEEADKGSGKKKPKAGVMKRAMQEVTHLLEK